MGPKWQALYHSVISSFFSDCYRVGEVTASQTLIFSRFFVVLEESIEKAETHIRNTLELQASVGGGNDLQSGDMSAPLPRQ